MKIRELDRRSADRRARDDLDRTTRQLRKALDRNARAFDQGFASAVTCLHSLLEERGWRLDRRGCERVLDALRAKVRRPQEIPRFARGTRDFSEDETQPLMVPDE